jgi:hypothetical protein
MEEESYVSDFNSFSIDESPVAACTGFFHLAIEAWMWEVKNDK